MPNYKISYKSYYEKTFDDIYDSIICIYELLLTDSHQHEIKFNIIDNGVLMNSGHVNISNSQFIITTNPIFDVNNLHIIYPKLDIYRRNYLSQPSINVNKKVKLSLNNHNDTSHKVNKKVYEDKRIIYNSTKKNDNNKKKIIKEAKVDKKLANFIYDKNSYIKMREDILNGDFECDDMNPIFFEKYETFELLLSKHLINLDNNDNIEKEFNNFENYLEQIKSILNEDLDTTQNNNIIISNDNVGISNNNNNGIYIPNNFNEMNKMEQIRYAEKFNMTLENFIEQIKIIN